MTLKELYIYASKIIKNKSEILILMKFFFNADRLHITIHGEQKLDSDKINLFLGLVDRLKNGEPIQYIVGETEFLNLKMSVGQGVFIPRPETEILAKKIVDIFGKNFSGSIIDLCSGSGNIPIYLKKTMPKSDVWAIEKSPDAFKFLEMNAKINDVKINMIMGDIFIEIEKFNDDKFDVIISNPPYIKTKDIEKLDKNVKFEPIMALDGGKDGLDFYRKIINNWSSKLKMGGIIAFEVGLGQSSYITDIMRVKFTNLKIIKDFSNIERIVIGTKN